MQGSLLTRFHIGWRLALSAGVPVLLLTSIDKGRKDFDAYYSSGVAMMKSPI